MADKDGSGEIDAEEACDLFSQFCCPSATIEEIRRTSASLRNQMDQDRNGKISFEEYAFRFGRKLQMELARRRREKLVPRGGSGVARGGQGGGYSSIYPAPPTDEEHDSYLRQRQAPSSSKDHTRLRAQRPEPGGNVGAVLSSSLTRESMTVAGIALVMLILVLFAIFSEGSTKFNARSKTR